MKKNALEMLKIYCSKFVLKMLAQQTTYDSRGSEGGPLARCSVPLPLATTTALCTGVTRRPVGV